MVYIQPNTTIKILRNVPLDNTYRNTLYFSSREQQYATFTSQVNDFVKYTIDNHSYQRHSNNSIKVEIWPEDLHDCNYLMFNNTSFGTKWFYAFIIDTEYVNNKTAIIYYEIDVMQTWLAGIDYTLPKVLIDREHTANDAIGANTVPEKINVGDYITTNVTEKLSETLKIYMFATEKIAIATGAVVNPQLFGGVPVSCYVYEFPLSAEGMGWLKNAIEQLQSDVDKGAESVVAIFVCADELVNTESAGSGGEVFALPALTLSVPHNEIRNNKLFTYPYCCCIGVADGSSIELKYELFSQSPSVKIDAAFGVNAQVVATPRFYEGNALDITRQLCINNWPQLPWINYAFQIKMGEAKKQLTQIPVSVAKTAVDGAFNFANATPTKRNPLAKIKAGKEAISSTLNTAAQEALNVVSTGIEGFTTPDTINGSVNAGDVNVYRGMFGFKFMCRSCKPEFIRIVDDYFTLYGYATKRVKVPNINVRKQWTYTKTVGFYVNGGFSNVYKDAICSIFDNGITFWRNVQNVGDYSLDNGIG